jgi:hypothetical protein
LFNQLQTGGNPLVVVILLKATERILDGSLFIPAYYGLFQALEKEQKRFAQVFAESVFGHGIAGLAGVFFIIWGTG